MSEYGALSTNGVSGGMKNDAFADAVQRARQVRPGMWGGPCGGGAWISLYWGSVSSHCHILIITTIIILIMIVGIVIIMIGGIGSSCNL